MAGWTGRTRWHQPHTRRWDHPATNRMSHLRHAIGRRAGPPRSPNPSEGILPILSSCLPLVTNRMSHLRHGIGRGGCREAVTKRMSHMRHVIGRRVGPPRSLNPSEGIRSIPTRNQDATTAVVGNRLWA